MNRKIVLSALMILYLPFLVLAQSIVSTKHNLSISGPGMVKANSESEICIFCHTPHNSNPIAPLWNRKHQGQTYTLYNSSTMQAIPGQPDGSSILCLSCHDGTVALGNIISRKENISFGPTEVMPIGASRLTTDLRDDHPISFYYDAALATADPQLKPPSAIALPVTLQERKLQCTSCHDPHKNMYNNFLVTSSQNSNLCNNCHQRTNWNTSIHNTSTQTWNGSGSNPWPYTPYTTVAQNACENCHNPHNSGGIPRLLKYQQEEKNCFDCHNGNVSTKNLQAEFTKTYKHNVAGYNGVHDPTETASPSKIHVECSDCHNPHATKNIESKAPGVQGALTGVLGISQTGSAVKSASYEYEVCYRCHSSNAVTPSATSRQIEQNNVRLEFDLSNPSYHPVTGEGKNTDVPSLIAPLTASSKIYCSDCHASNGSDAPKGPHGSIYPQILKAQYVRTDNTVESAANYALCYSCHSRTSILGNNSFSRHSRHIIDFKAPCNVCHDSHGISSTQGNSINNSNLINFQNSVVTASSSGIRRYDDEGQYKGKCYLTCHGKNHNPMYY